MKILVTYPATRAHIEEFRSCAPHAELIEVEQRSVSEADVADAEVIIGNIPSALIARAKRLRFLQLNSSGAEEYVPYARAGLPIAVTSGAYGLAISEHMLGMMLMLMKRLHQYRDNQRERLWRDEGDVTSVEDAVVLVVGVGDIGGEFARKCKLLGAYTIGVRRDAHDKPAYLDELHTLDALRRVCPRADVVAMCLPGGGGTHKLLNRELLALLKPGAIVLNVGRGGAIDTEALADAVEDGRLLCGLDVTDPEPLPAGHRLWGLQNALITPHISGFYHLRQTVERIGDIALENLRRYVAGAPLLNLLDPETGYRSAENRYER
ncbi:MAG: D-2-hydroxyacid dehydrogenase [Clostridia bacterium]|nr:D-2-hydroxyacid dehydrogenase [Clostridia bacterium]